MMVIAQIIIFIIEGVIVGLDGILSALPFYFELSNVLDTIKELFIAGILGVSPTFIHIVLSIFDLVILTKKIVLKLANNQ